MPNAVCYICLIWCLPGVCREISASVWYKSRDWAVILGGGWAVWKQSGGKELGRVVRAALVPVPSERLEVSVTKEGVPGVPPRAALHQGPDVQ